MLDFYTWMFASVGGILQDLIYKYVWSPNKRATWTAGDDIYDTNGNIIHSFYSFDNVAQENVTPRSALQNSTVYACTYVRGNTIASLPCNVIRENNNTKEVLVDHPAYYLISQQPNSYLSAANFWKTIMLHVDVWGNGYAFIQRDSRRNPVSLHIWEPWEVSVTYQDGDIFYHYQGETESSSEILHYRFYSFDGICGRSPVTENRNAIGMALKLDRYSAILMGTRPPGVLSYEGQLSPEQRAENKKQWSQGSASDVKILSGRWKFDPIMTPADDSSFAVAKEMIEQQLSAIWQMPPTFLQNYKRATHSNAEQGDLVYAKHTITPICRNIELENNMKLFFEKEKANTYTKFNMNGLLRGDIAARQAFYQSMVNTGVMNRNEARSLEDLNPYPDGDNFLVQGAMVPADLLREKYQKELLTTVQPPINGKSFNGKHYVN